jgi:hypothetical protein
VNIQKESAQKMLLRHLRHLLRRPAVMNVVLENVMTLLLKIYRG